MICGFRAPTSQFTDSLDDVMATVTSQMASLLNRLVSLLKTIKGISSTYITSTTEPYFYTTHTRINRLVPLPLRTLLEAYDYYVAAIWNDTKITEIYILSHDASSDEMETMESLSQSFIQT